MSAAKLPAPVAIPQPHSPYEQLAYGALEVPAIFVEKFHAVAALAKDELTDPDSEVPASLIAAVTIDDRSFSHKTLAWRALALDAADAAIREHPGEPFVNANRPSLTAGIIDENEGLVVIPWHSTIDYGTGLAIPSRSGVNMDFFGSDYRSFRDIDKKLPENRHMRFITPDTVALDSASIEALDVRDEALNGGVLAIGEEAVGRFFEDFDSAQIAKIVSLALGRRF